ncbi:MAG: AAA family ATPase [Lachnobacterium sp.]|nr:AAA family ATPase [Lachnobacterium sp.]
MHSNTKEVLDKIHGLQSGKEFAVLCDQMYNKLEQNKDETLLDQLLAMNYIFFMEEEENADYVLELFNAFLRAMFDFVSEEPAEYYVPDGEYLEETMPRVPIRQMKNGLFLNRVGDVSPSISDEKRRLKTLVTDCFLSKCDLRGAGISKLGDERNTFYRKLLRGKGKGIIVFCLPTTKAGLDEAAYIHRYFPINEIHFDRVSDEDYARQCITSIRAVNSDCIVDESSIISRIGELRKRNAFFADSTLDIIKSEYLYNDIIQNNSRKKNDTTISFEELALKYQRLNKKVNDKVKGQVEVVSKVTKALFTADMRRDTRKKGPKASFLLMGAPGVGKTLLAETISEELSLPYMILNMSDYSAENSYIDLVGESKRFKGCSEGKLVKFVRENPKSVIVFDEIEKAELNVIHLFLQILDMGILMNAYTEQYEKFGETIIFFTSNVGRNLYKDERNRVLSRLPESMLVEAIQSEKNPATNEAFFPQAISSRMASGNICMMNRMETDVLLEIIQDSIKNATAQLEKIYGFSIVIEPEIYSLFMYQQGNKLDARVASKKSVDFIMDELYEISRILDDSNQLMADKKCLKFEISDEIDGEYRNLFDTRGLCGRVLYFGKDDFNFEDDRIEIETISSIEALEKCFSRDYSFVVIDPFYGYEKEGFEKVCINDVESIGMDAFRMLMSGNTDTPVYVWDRNECFNNVDVDSFILDGAEGVISGKDSAVRNEILRISARQEFFDKHDDFCNRGYTLSFSSKQLINGDELIIQFYNIQKVLAPDSNSAKIMVSGTERPTVKLKDVIGAEEAKDQLQFFIKYLKDPQKTIISGGKAPKGLLLYGPPGTGKTMLAKSLAGETDAVFIATSASELLAPLQGEGEAKIRYIFETARKYAPAIIFIDEIDAIGKMRTGAENTAGIESMLNVLLTEMDGFSTNSRKSVFVIAATNFGVDGDTGKKVKLDPALLRRFDNQVFVNLPNEESRLKYLKIALAKESGIQEAAIKNIAKRSLGKSIADLENIVNLAYRNAAKIESRLTDNILLDAYEQAIFGLKKERDEEYYRKVAIHEAGHAVIAHLSGNTPAFMTIMGRADFGGYVELERDENKGVYTEMEYRWRIRQALAGRVAEKIFFGQEASINTGSSSDLAQATNLALDMITRLGFMPGQLVVLTPEMVDEKDIYITKANEILLEEFGNCEKLLTENKQMVEKLAETAIEKNYLTQEQIANVLKL